MKDYEIEENMKKEIRSKEQLFKWHRSDLKQLKILLKNKIATHDFQCTKLQEEINLRIGDVDNLENQLKKMKGNLKDHIKKAKEKDFAARRKGKPKKKIAAISIKNGFIDLTPEMTEYEAEYGKKAIWQGKATKGFLKYQQFKKALDEIEDEAEEVLDKIADAKEILTLEAKDDLPQAEYTNPPDEEEPE